MSQNIVGPSTPGTIVDDSSVGTVAWTNPSNAAISDNSYATAVCASSAILTHYLKCTNFGFSIPANAIITGIVVGIERFYTAGTGAADSSIKLVKDGVIGSTDKAAGGWSNTDPNAYINYGSQSDLWGIDLTPADINSSGFGVAISARGNGISGGTADIDSVAITVYYSLNNQNFTTHLRPHAFSPGLAR